MANSSPDDLTAQLRAALRNMADAYERRIRTDCTAEQLALEPWRCAEYIEAERLCKRPFKLLIDNETLKRQIAAEPDGMSYEAGVLHPEAPKPNRVVHISVGDGAYMELPLKDWLWQLRYNRKEPERGTKCDDRMLSAGVMESYLYLLNCTKEEAWRRIKILRAATQ